MSMLAGLVWAMSLSADSLSSMELDAHPRPDWSRPCALLNGPWQFDFDPQDAGIKEQWFVNHAFTKTIQVPFPWQSELSGIHDTAYQGAAWYQREFTIPAGIVNRRIFLVFGAVDWQATVWINGQQAAEHEGGYLPFEVDLTDRVKPGETARVTVRAFDVTDPETPTGKQTGWYTPSGGIWQSVYLEYRGKSYLRDGRITPDIDASTARFECTIEAAAAGEYSVAVHAIEGFQRYSVKQTVACKAGANPVRLVLPIAKPKLWTPDSPTLYDARIVLSHGDDIEDWVSTYFGMRKISRGVYGDAGHEYILLNGKPVYLRGALHQSFNPKGLYTHPDDAFIRNDYAKAKEFGLNFVRIHIKLDEPRALYWADKLGVMLMCDMPNFTRNTDRAHTLWEAMLRGAIARDFNHPSIVAWCCFNETWGIGDGGYTPQTQQWVRDMYLLTKQLDPTRLVEDNSPCKYDHTQTDINSWHFYIDKYSVAAHHIAEVVEKTIPGSEFNYAPGWKQDTAPLINSEYGGVSAGSGDRDISWVFLYLTNLLRKYDKIGGYVYTELEDIEWEHNGFMNYDRSPKTYNYPANITLADLQGADVPVLDCPPYQQVDARAHVSIPVLLSHWSERTDLKLRVFVEGSTIDGMPWSGWFKPMEQDVTGKPYTVTQAGAYTIDLPGATGLISVVAELLSEGQRVGATYCVLDARGASWVNPDVWAAPFDVAKFSEYAMDIPTSVFDQHPGKVFGHKAGYIEYQIKMPMALTADKIASCRLIAELASKADKERLDWPERTKQQDYPQTDGKTWPTDITVSVDGVPFKDITIDNDYADARGVLSHEAGYQHGSCGVVVDAPIEGPALEALKQALTNKRVVTVRFEVKPDAAHVGGISLYGNSMGSLGADPTLLFGLTPGAKKPKGEAKALHPKPRDKAKKQATP